MTRQRELLSLAPALGELAEGDAVVWFAYPKGTSTRYETDISRDTGWQAVRAEKFEGVRMVAIDEDWSAKRVRRADYIKRADS